MGGISNATAESLLNFFLLILVIIVLTICIFILILKERKLIKINPFWLWSQLIPFWSFIAIPITLIKINKQLKKIENFYKATYSWIWFFTSILSIFFAPILILNLISFILFYKQLQKVGKTL
ncbi:hypothetical protein [Halarcobacter bivalviorum]|uniref:Membrane protein n=1 Tax=Halarcobacter bivalviorum TaxID=663364 RepID=A0AAX2A8E7_9BACT|nr:hypothetical protein [Halarcobacter bivalviorum]AXH13158.1 putative membrane protein [Halarcobacter bivalviorum]RXK10230.1 hypothetical protein CRV05_07585 [Halarcobacter bivalviorum]